MPVKADCDGMM